MATSGTRNFNLNITQIIERAFQRTGGEFRSSEDAENARINLNLLFLDLQNKGIPLGSLHQTSFTTVAGQTQYVLPAGQEDVLQAVTRRGDTELPMERMALFEYSDITNKTTQARSYNYALDRGRDNIIINLYPAPNNDTDEIVYWCYRKPEDASGPRFNIDFNTRYLPAIISGLAWYVARENTLIPIEKVRELKLDYQEELKTAFSEDMERTSYKIIPHLRKL